MQLWEDRLEPSKKLPTTIRLCRVCQRETPHQIRFGCGVVAKICVPCLEQSLMNGRGRD